MVVELRVVHFGLKSNLRFQIELGMRVHSSLKSFIGFQTELPSTQFNHHYKSCETSLGRFRDTHIENEKGKLSTN